MSFDIENFRAGAPRTAIDVPGQGSSSASGFNAGISVAQIFDVMLGGSSASPLQSALESGRAADLRQAIQQLTPEQRSSFERRMPSASREALLSLSRERDSELFGEGLLHWAGREENAGRMENAALAYEMLRHHDATGQPWIAAIPEGVRARASRRLDANEGRGEAGARMEVLARRFFREATSPSTLVGMAAGGMVFSSVRSVILARTLASGRGLLGARALASLGAFSAEVPAFWATSKGLNEVMNPGSQSWDARSNFQELAGLALTLGALKISGSLAGSATRWAHRPIAGQASRFAALSGLSQRLAPQLGMLGGIMAGHRLEEAVGLRPHIDGATTLTDSLVMLLQFNIGGRLSREMMGPRFHSWTQELELRSRRMESEAFARQGARLRGGLETLFPGDGPGAAMAMASVGGGSRRGRGSLLPENVFAMVGDPEGVGSGSHSERATESLPLPRRTGRVRNGNNLVVDKLEPEIQPQEYLRLLPETVRDEILQKVGFDSSQIGRVNEMHFGDGLAMSLERRIQDVLLNPGTFSPDQPLENLPESYREALRSADELVGVIEHLRRSNNPRVVEAFEAAMDPNVFAHYEALKEHLVQYLGPHFTMPGAGRAVGSEVIQPHQAILSIGSGDMMGLLALYRHNIRPGGLSWRSRLFATARDPVQANEINSQGTNRSKINLRNIQINYLHDPPIEAVGPGGYRGLTQEVLQRSIRLQLLNLPSDQLHKVLTPEYLRNLPENAVLLEVIGGFIAHENLGRYREGLEEGRSLLPYQLIRRALEANGRRDVSVVSGGGFIPGKFLWHGESVRMVFAGQEGAAPHSAPAAELVARTFAGRYGQGDFLTASVSHHQHSTELGKAMKNVTTLLGGYQAAEMVAQQMEAGAVDLAALQGRYEMSVRNPLFEGVMKGLLRDNEVGISPNRADFRLEVADDYWRCSQIGMEEVFRLLTDARTVDVMDRQALRTFILERVVNNPKLAATRNPKRGMVQSLYNLWRQSGTPFELRHLLPMEEDGVTPKMTEEGVNSLFPMTRYYDHSSQPVERRRLPEAMYEGYRAFNPGSPILLPPEVPRSVRQALDGQMPGVDPIRLRRVLAGRSERSMRLLDQHLRRFERFQRMKDRFPEQALQEHEVALRLIDSMEEGEPRRVTRSPVIRHPYGNMFVIRMQGDEQNQHVYRSYIRVDGQKVMDRITQLGTFLRSFPEGSRMLTEINVTGLDPLEHARERAELEMTLQRILDAYQRVRPQDRLVVMLGNARIQGHQEVREPPSRQYFQDLTPLVDRLRASLSEGASISPQIVRNTGQGHGGLIENFLQNNPGWPMLLGYFGGPLNQALKSALTRPERGTVVGIYSGGKMLDAFSVFRGPQNQPMALNHGLMSHLKARFPEETAYQGINSTHFFEGMKLDNFLRDYERYAEAAGHSDLQYRLVSLRSLPLEEALTGRAGVNPALLRIFLEMPGPNAAREAMFQELAPLYERPFEEVRAETLDILQRYLEPFKRDHQDFISQVPLFTFFEKKGSRALGYLMRNGDTGETQ